MIYWFVHSIILIFLALLVYKKWTGDLHPGIFWSALVIRLLAGILLGYIFLHYYDGGDTWLFYNEAKDLASLPAKTYFEALFSASDYQVTSKPRVLFFAKLVSLFIHVTDGSYWIVSLYLSFLSFCAYLYISMVVGKTYPGLKYLAIVTFLFVPSVVFWSSGVLKGTLANSALVILVAISLNHKKNLLPKILVGLLSLFVLFKVKHYLLIAFILFLGVYIAATLFTKHRGLTRLSAILALIVAMALTQFIHPFLKIDRLAQTLYDNNKAIIEKTKDGNQVDIKIKSAEWEDIIEEIPKALHTGLFRPSFTDRIHIWGWIHVIENTIFALLLILSILLLYKTKPSLDVPILIAASIAIVLLSTMLALSTPNFGTLVRYKNAFMPFLFLIASILPFQYLTAKG